jgi:hypothetical protein
MIKTRQASHDLLRLVRKVIGKIMLSRRGERKIHTL